MKKEMDDEEESNDVEPNLGGISGITSKDFFIL